LSAGNFSSPPDAVLAEHALACLEQLAHAIGAMGLGDGDQGDDCGITAGALRRVGDALCTSARSIGASLMRRAHHARRGLGVVGIGRQRGVEGLARLVLLPARQADAVVAEQPRIARQAAQRMLVQRRASARRPRSTSTRPRLVSTSGSSVDSREARFSARRASSKRFRPRSARPWLLSARTSSGAA
jgi:hypothetical protein